MKKINSLRIPIIITIIISLIFPVSIYAAAPEAGSLQNQSQPIIEILNTSTSSMELIIRFPETPITENNTGVIFNENIYSHPSEVGVPDLPVIVKNIELPIGSNYSLEILAFKSYTGVLGEDGLPAIIQDRAPEVEKCDPDDELCSLSDQNDLNATETNITALEDPTVTATLEPTTTATLEATPSATLEATPSATVEATPSATPEPTTTATLEATPTATATEETESAPIDDFFPVSPVQLLNTYVVRGHQVGQIQFWPVQYSPTNQVVMIYQEITVKINFQQTDLMRISQTSAAYSSPAFEEVISDQIINYNQDLQIKTTRDSANEKVLIIAPDAFISTLSSLVSLKESQGHPVTLVSLSTTGATPEAIKSYIQNAYQTWPVPPTYVILVGDINNGSETMPAYTGESTNTATDLYYGTVDGTDWIPDVFVGRLPARNTTQLNIMINNLISYNNLSGAEDWVKKAAFLASNDANYWEVAEGTQNYVIQNHTTPAGYTGTFPNSPLAGGDKLFAYTYSAGNTQVINAVNNRRSLISYTGHGSRASWGGPAYSQSNIQNINHTGTFSVVTSFACVTGDFSVTESFGETWLLQSNKGAVAFIGSSANSYWGPDDLLERSMMDSLFSGTESANIVSAFRFAGLMAVETIRPGTGTAQSRYYWETYNLLGDPSLAMLLGPKPVEPVDAFDPQFTTTAISVGQSPGQNAIIQLELTNAGSSSDSYDLTNITSSIWEVELQSSKLIVLNPGESTLVEISITIPADAEIGQKEEFSISVTSINDPESPQANDTAKIDLMASMMSFIPIVINN